MRGKGSLSIQTGCGVVSWSGVGCRFSGKSGGWRQDRTGPKQTQLIPMRYPNSANAMKAVLLGLTKSCWSTGSGTGVCVDDDMVAGDNGGPFGVVTRSVVGAANADVGRHVGLMGAVDGLVPEQESDGAMARKRLLGSDATTRALQRPYLANIICIRVMTLDMHQPQICTTLASFSHTTRDIFINASK